MKNIEVKFAVGDKVRVKDYKGVFTVFSVVAEMTGDDIICSYTLVQGTSFMIDIMDEEDIEGVDVDELDELLVDDKKLSKKDVNFLLDTYNKYKDLETLYASLGHKTEYSEKCEKIVSYLKTHT